MKIKSGVDEFSAVRCATGWREKKRNTRTRIVEGKKHHTFRRQLYRSRGGFFHADNGKQLSKRENMISIHL